MDSSYYAVIPANVRYDNRLSANAKLMYGELTSLSNKYGYCWATNEYFAKLYDVDKNTVSRWISELRNCGHVKCDIIYKDGSKQIKERRIYLVYGEYISSTPTYKNTDTPVHENVSTPIHENGEVNKVIKNNMNNTSNIQRFQNNQYQKEERKEYLKRSADIQIRSTLSVIEDFTKDNDIVEKLKQYLKAYRETRTTPVSIVQLERMLEKLNDLSYFDGETSKQRMLDIIQQSIDKNWNGFFKIVEEKSNRHLFDTAAGNETKKGIAEMNEEEYKAWEAQVADEEF